MKTKAFWAVICLLTLSACGPLIGGMMMTGNGVKNFEVLEGSLGDLSSGSRIAVLGPFDKTEEAFYICRGEEAAAFTNAFNQSGLFSAELAIENRFPEKLPQPSQFKGQSQSEVQKSLGLQKTPELIMSGTILMREMTVAPANGVIMTASYRLEFLNLINNQTTTIEVTTQEMFQDVIPETVAHLAKQMSDR